MSKFKPVRPKAAKTPQIRAGLPCVVLVILAMIFIMALLFLVMKNAS
ncbi:MAG: hypothetical protein M3Y07_08785 [Acidobacteriota bacterium]|nr:hypothetical protein [Acidobacteriota bacterium]